MDYITDVILAEAKADEEGNAKYMYKDILLEFVAYLSSTVRKRDDYESPEMQHLINNLSSLRQSLYGTKDITRTIYVETLRHLQKIRFENKLKLI